MRCLPGLVVVLSLAGTASAAPALVTQSDPYPGIHRETWEDEAIPAVIHLVRIDLTSAEIGLYATKESEHPLTTSGYASLRNAQVAINGDSFTAAAYRPYGLAMGDSVPWTMTADDASRAVLHIRRVGERTVATIDPPEAITILPDGTQAAISGRPLLVRAGVAVPGPAFDCDDAIAIPCVRAPRTAVAVSEDGDRMWLAVVDGWQDGSIGMRAAELAAFLDARGADMALALDGGSSSTLVIGGVVASSPSEGIERTVANHLGIKYGALPKGTMRGYICNTPDFTACGVTPSLQVSGATVTLDDDRVHETPPNEYIFANVTPRKACVTVTKTGYKTNIQCRDVPSGDTAYGSVFLEVGVDPPDAGVTDAAVPDDADLGPDGGPRPDGGNPIDGPGPGCCETGDLGGSHVLLVALVAFMLVRRRGTNASG